MSQEDLCKRGYHAVALRDPVTLQWICNTCGTVVRAAREDVRK